MENPFEIILQKLEIIEKSIEELKSNLTENNTISIEIFDVKELADYVKLAVTTVYGLIHKNKYHIIKRVRNYISEKMKLMSGFRKDEMGQNPN